MRKGEEGGKGEPEYYHGSEQGEKKSVCTNTKIKRGMESKEYISSSLQQKKQWLYCKRYTVCCVPLVQKLGTLSTGHLINFLLLSFKYYKQFISGKINKTTTKSPALMVAYEKRSWATTVRGDHLFHSLHLKKSFKLLEIYRMHIYCLY